MAAKHGAAAVREPSTVGSTLFYAVYHIIFMSMGLLLHTLVKGNIASGGHFELRAENGVVVDTTRDEGVPFEKKVDAWEADTSWKGVVGRNVNGKVPGYFCF